MLISCSYIGKLLPNHEKHCIWVCNAPRYTISEKKNQSGHFLPDPILRAQTKKLIKGNTQTL